MIYTFLRVLLVSSFLFSINSKIDQLQEESKFQEALKLCEDNYNDNDVELLWSCLLYTSPSPRDLSTSRMPPSA